MADWNKIKKEYLAGMKPAEICKKYKVNKNTLDTHRKIDGWKKSKNSVNEKLTEKIANKEAEKILKIKEDFSKEWDIALEVLKSVEIRNAMDLNNYTNSLSKIQAGKFKCYDIPDKVDVNKSGETIEKIEFIWPQSK